MAVTLVVAWDTNLTEPLEVRRVVNKRDGIRAAEELEKFYPWSPRISFYAEVDFVATEAGMVEAEVKRAQAQIERRKGA